MLCLAPSQGSVHIFCSSPYCCIFLRAKQRVLSSIVTACQTLQYNPYFISKESPSNPSYINYILLGKHDLALPILSGQTEMPKQQKSCENCIQGQTVKNLQQEADLSTEVLISQGARFLLQCFPDQIADRLLLNDPVPSHYLLFPT